MDIVGYAEEASTKREIEPRYLSREQGRYLLQPSESLALATVKELQDSQRIYQPHVALLDIEPMVWQRLWVTGSLKLSNLVRIIPEAFGWINIHLHELTIQEVRYGE